MNTYNESHRLLKALPKEKEIWDKKLAGVKIKVKEITRRDSLDVALLRQQGIEAEVLELTDEVVYTYGIYFGRDKEQVSFLYPELDMRKWNSLRLFVMAN